MKTKWWQKSGRNWQKIQTLITASIFTLLISFQAKADSVTRDLVGLGMEPALAEYISGMAFTKLSNAEWLQWRNALDTAYIGAIRVDTNDDTVLMASQNDNIKFIADEDTNRYVIFGSNTDTDYWFKYGDPTVDYQAFGLFSNTSDLHDHDSLVLGGGGSGSNTRGAYLDLRGNEALAGGGNLMIAAGNTASGSINMSTSGASGAIVLGSLSGEGWRMNASNHLVSAASTGGDIVFNPTPGIIRQGTVDGTDSASLAFNGGGGNGISRGAGLTLYGNEHATRGGDLDLTAGDVGTGVLGLLAPNAAGMITQSIGGNIRWTTEADGDLAGDASNGGDIIFNRAGKNIVLQETGGNACMGTDTFTAAADKVVSTTCAKAGARIFLTRTSLDADTTGDYYVKSINPGVSFTVFSEVNDTATFNWIIFNEAP